MDAGTRDPPFLYQLQSHFLLLVVVFLSSDLETVQVRALLCP